jgi:hypothetical protein
MNFGEDEEANFDDNEDEATATIENIENFNDLVIST